MKRLFALAILGAACAGAWAQDADLMTYRSLDFENGFPSDAAVFDIDGRDLYFTMVQNGFESRDSWRVLREEGKENHYLAAASRFKEAGKADDLFMTGPVWIRGDKATISWRARSYNERNDVPCTYLVKIMEYKGALDAAAASKENLLVDLGSYSEPAAGEWQHHSADLNSLAGKKVVIVFENVTEGGEIIAVDDIKVEGAKGLAEVTVTPGDYVLGADRRFRIGGSVTAWSDTPVTSFSAKCLVDGKEYSASLSDISLKKGESREFSFPVELQGDFGDSFDFTVTPAVNGIEYPEEKHRTTLLSFLPKRNVVIEEATGTWCMYCPKGIVAFRVLEEKYPNDFIPIAVHMMAAADRMALDDYANEQTFEAGAPSAWVDRKVYSADPMTPVFDGGQRVYSTLYGGLETLFLRRMAEQAIAEVSSMNISLDGNEFRLSADCRFPLNIDKADYRLAVVLTEDRLISTQANAFSNGSDIVGGFEKLDRTIENFEHNHVARAIYDDYYGIPGSLPGKIVAGESYNFSRTFKMPAKYNDVKNMQAVVMILDHATGEVLNSRRIPLDTSGVSGIGSDSRISVVCEGDAVRVLVPSSGHFTARMYDASGREIAFAEAEGETLLSAAGYDGIAILEVVSAEGRRVVKLAF